MQLAFRPSATSFLSSLLLLPALLLAGCANGSNGPSVEDYIRADTYAAMVFEVDRVPEVTPNSSSLDSLVATAGSVLDKPSGVTWVSDQVLTSAGTSPTWTTAQLRALSDESRNLPVDPDTITMQLLYVNGTWSESENVIGLQIYRNAVVLFEERIQQACQSGFPLIQAQLCRGLESTVLAHEFGHAIGLVNNGLKMVTPHEDPAHPGHDPDSNCLMYWAAEGSNFASALGNRITGGGSEALTFCMNSLDDIAAVRNR